MVQREWQVEVSHIYKEANQRADCLANLMQLQDRNLKDFDVSSNRSVGLTGKRSRTNKTRNLPRPLDHNSFLLNCCRHCKDFGLAMGKMYKKKKHADGHGPSKEHTDTPDQEMDIRKIMRDVENFSYSHMPWKERKKIENRKVISLGGKPPRNQRLPLSVARPMMKKQKEREQKMLQEHMILGQFGGKLGGSSKRSVGKHKPENRGLKSSEGRFRNGILDVKHLLNSVPSRDHDTGSNMSMSSTGKRKGGKMKHAGKKHH